MLIDDAAAPFLLTAGIGSSMAMECAACWRTSLRDAKHLVHTLSFAAPPAGGGGAERQPPHGTHDVHPPPAWGRDQALKLYSLEQLVKQIARILSSRSDARPRLTRELLGSDIWALLLGLAAGLACGFLNTAASSGSAVSLPIVMMIGLDRRTVL